MEAMNVQQTATEDKAIKGANAQTPIAGLRASASASSTTEEANAQTPIAGKPYKDKWLEAMVKGFRRSGASKSSREPLLHIMGLNEAESIAKSYFYISALAARETRAEYQLALIAAAEALTFIYNRGGVDKDYKSWLDYSDDELAKAAVAKGDGSWWGYYADILRERLEKQRIREERGLCRPSYLDEEIPS
jgi:hypothetical protein